MEQCICLGMHSCMNVEENLNSAVGIHDCDVGMAEDAYGNGWRVTLLNADKIHYVKSSCSWGTGTHAHTRHPNGIHFYETFIARKNSPFSIFRWVCALRYRQTRIFDQWQDRLRSSTFSMAQIQRKVEILSTFLVSNLAHFTQLIRTTNLQCRSLLKATEFWIKNQPVHR